jgi:hypothetical protein
VELECCASLGHKFWVIEQVEGLDEVVENLLIGFLAITKPFDKFTNTSDE